MGIFNEPPEHDFECGHVCHKRGLNPWIKECPTCGCSNPAYDPETVSDIDPPDTFVGLEGAMALLFAASRKSKPDTEG